MNKNEPVCRLCYENWHAFDIQHIFEKLGSHPEGLTLSEVEKNRQLYGSNVLPKLKPPTLLKIIWHQIRNPLIFILLAVSVLSLTIGEKSDAIFILAVIFFNSCLGAYQEFNAEKSALALQNNLQINGRVMRDNTTSEISAEMLVPGDIVLLESGNKVPADLRLMEVQNLLVDESFLTGESLPVEKTLTLLTPEITLADRLNMVYAGATVMSGRGTGIVVGTGIETQIGLIEESIILTESAKPPLVIRMESFIRQISLIILITSIIIAILLRLQGHDAYFIFFFVVALAVSAIPEGLPVALTVTLSIATKRMAKRKVIVRHLNAVESLGSCTVIASDKTGTLTVNEQTARLIVLPDSASFSITGEGYNGIGEILPSKDIDAQEYRQQLEFLSTLSILANEAALTNVDGQWTHHGDAIDVAFLGLAYKLGLQPAALKQEYPLIGEIPYESANKLAAAFFKKEEKVYVAVKGAVEVILDLCKHMQRGENVEELDWDLIEQQSLEMAKGGLRVMAVGYAEIPDFVAQQTYGLESLHDLTAMGLVGFLDPLRPDVIDSIDKCKKAGIKVIMITGDHPVTASAIAAELHLNDKETTITGKDLDGAKAANTETYRKLVNSSNVFARVNPLQKLDIVDSLINQGEFVAVTGDGVNDTPALKRAHIGIAMGSGTDAAKETGSLIIADDNFSTIVSGVEEGRHAYANVRKVIYVLMSTATANVVIFLVALLMGWDLPLVAVQLLWLNLVTNGIQVIGLAFEGGEPTAMQKPPRGTKEKIFDKQMSFQVAISGVSMGLIALASWFWLTEIQNYNAASARNLVLMIMVLSQNVHTFNCRSETISVFKIPIRQNYPLFIGILCAQGIHLLSMNIPVMQKVLHIAPIPGKLWLMALGFSLFLIIIMEIYKALLGLKKARSES